MNLNIKHSGEVFEPFARDLYSIMCLVKKCNVSLDSEKIFTKPIFNMWNASRFATVSFKLYL